MSRKRLLSFSVHPIEIKDFERFLSEDRANHKFILSEADPRRLEKVLAAHMSARRIASPRLHALL
jgi:hypothetical protein